jgi:hypothetical protein
MAAHSQQEPQQQQQHGPRSTAQLTAVDISEENFRPFGQLIGPTDDGKEYDGEDAQLEGLGEGQPRWAGSCGRSCRQPASGVCVPGLLCTLESSYASPDHVLSPPPAAVQHARSQRISRLLLNHAHAPYAHAGFTSCGCPGGAAPLNVSRTTPRSPSAWAACRWATGQE